ncbi:hypothetical protein [Streptomyces sp. NRRL S-378]|uniref:hypothetical protein n=1 Tax=Streptomyces sp. NRRL S-378 TaxID=1463904 RepID=UPI00099CEDF1|nr:hypothetical protein [Streptomyces sp. NRRL S-378]
MPSAAYRSVRARISSSVIADSCASQAILRAPSGEHDIRTPRPISSCNFELGVPADVTDRSRQF